MQQSIWPESENHLEPTRCRQLLDQLRPALTEWISARSLPESFLAVIESVILPLAAFLHTDIERRGRLILGLSGGQGAGKSTLSSLLVDILALAFRKKAVTFSIDDIYLTRDERQQLAADIHPLLATRGVPGTHDPLLGLYLIQQLRAAEPGDNVNLPVFDKAIDDRLPPEQWRVASGPFDLVIFEGWCVGAMPQAEKELVEPINELERREDPDASWRTFVNTELAGSYMDLFACLDLLLMLKVPDMEQVFEWRLKQEEELGRHRAGDATAGKVMDEKAVRRFIRHYERITRSMLDEMPQRADIVFELDRSQRIADVRLNRKA